MCNSEEAIQQGLAAAAASVSAGLRIPSVTPLVPSSSVEGEGRAVSQKATGAIVFRRKRLLQELTIVLFAKSKGESDD